MLADGDCGSACDHLTSAVKDLDLGPLVGTRTSGLGKALTLLAQ